MPEARNEPGAQRDGGKGQPCRDEVERVVQPCRERAEPDVFFVLFPPERVEGVHGSVQHGQRRRSGEAEEEEAGPGPEQGGQDAVREVFGHALHAGARHAVGVEFGCIAAHEHGNGLAGSFGIFPGKRDRNPPGMFAEAARRDAGIYQDDGCEPARTRPAVPLRSQHEAARHGGGRQGREQAGQPSGQKHPRSVGAAPEPGFETGGQRPHQADGMDPVRQFTEQAVHQEHGRQQREPGKVHFSPMLR